MTGVIIVGGLGTRLRPVVADKPKCLAPVNGQPFLFHLLQQMVDAGVSRIVLCTGYQAEQVEACVGSVFAGVPVDYSHETDPLGTGGALKLAFDRYGCENSWLVMNGDSYLELDIASFKHQFLTSTCIAALGAVRVPDGRRFGGLRCLPNGRICAFEEKSDAPGPKWINGGVYLLSPQFLAGLPATTPLSLERDVFPKCITNGLLAYASRGRFIDIGLPESFAEAQTFFAESLTR